MTSRPTFTAVNKDDYIGTRV